MQPKNPLLALLLSLLPGVGHMYLGRKVRGSIYCFIFIALIMFSIFIFFAVQDGEPVAVTLLFAFILGVINMIDMVLTLILRPQAIWPPPPPAVLNGTVPESYHEQGGYNAAMAAGMAEAGYTRSDGSSERFLTILLSFIPGLGHFHLGLMHRGLTLLIGFFGLLAMIFFVTLLTDVEGFLVFLLAIPVIWLYGMFDTVQLLHRKQKGELLVDRTILEDFDKQREDGRKSKVIATLLSIFPGAGHLYLGLQRRGIQLMAAFLFSIYILDVLRLSLFLFFVPIIWFFSFFDAQQQASRYQAGQELVDKPLVEWLLNHQRWVGVGLLLLGAFYLFDTVLISVFDQFWDPYQVSYYIRTYFQTTVVSIVLIGGGIYMLAGRKKKRQEEGAEEA